MLVDGVSVVLGSFRLGLSKDDCTFASCLFIIAWAINGVIRVGFLAGKLG